MDEFARNKERVAVDATRSLQSHFNLVRDAVCRFGEETEKADTLKTLNEVDHAAIMKGEAVNDSITRIEKLFASAPPLPTTDAVKARVTDRAIANRAPYHRSKNSMGDAVMIEIYVDQVAADRPEDTRLAFVTHNIRDFSEPAGDQRKPHPDLTPLFDGTVSNYSVSLIDAIKAVDEDLLADHDLEFNGMFQPRRLSEILEGRGSNEASIRSCRRRTIRGTGIDLIRRSTRYGRGLWKPPSGLRTRSGSRISVPGMILSGA